MKRLSKIPGYRDSETKRFNVMYEYLVECIGDSEAEAKESLYNSQQLQAFRTYLILADADENKRYHAMSFKTKLEDYSLKEIEHFHHMEDVLEEFNRLADYNDIDIALILPNYSDIEMIELGRYQGICQDHVVKKWIQSKK